MNNPNIIGKGNRKATKFFAVAWTIIYVILFPCALYMSCFSLGFLGDSKRMEFVNIGMVFVMFWIPFSMPAGIYLMWSNFSRQKYKRVVFWGFLPWLTFVVADVVVEILGFLGRKG